MYENMKIKCSQCGQQYDFDSSKEGQMFACLECGNDFVISFSDGESGVSVRQNNTPVLAGGIALGVVIVVVLFLCLFVKGSAPKNTISGEEIKKKAMAYIAAGDCLNVAKLLQSQDLRKNGVEFLFAAVHSGRTDMIQTILACGIDINTVNEKGETCLHIATRNNNFKVFKFLLKNGVKMESSVSQDDSVWGIAAEKGMTKIIEYLAVSQQFVNENSNCEKAIFRALDNGHIECVKILLEKYLINDQDKNGNTILMAAIRNNNVELAKIALGKFADVTVLNNKGESALFIALKKNNPQLLEIFDLATENLNFQTNNGTSLPMICVKVGNHTAMSQVVTDSNVNLIDDKGKTALYYACEKNDIATIKLLLSKKAVIVGNIFENSPLYIAVKKNNLVACKELLKHVNISSLSALTDSQDNNLLMLAAATGDEKMFNHFPLDVFDLFKKNKFGKMALDIAAEKSSLIKNKLLDKMDSINYAKAVQIVKSVKHQSLSAQLNKITELKSQMAGFKKTVTYLDNIQTDITRRIANNATSRVYDAIASAKKDRYYESAIRTLENAIANNPTAKNLQEAQTYLSNLKARFEAVKNRQAQLEKKKNEVRKMGSLRLEQQMKTFINSWLQDMQMDRPLSKYYGFGCSSTFFNVKRWSILGPSDGNWSHFEEVVIVAIDSTNKGGNPISVNWKITLRRDNDMEWKVADVSD